MLRVLIFQQVTALKKERPHPLLEDVDRAFWVALRDTGRGSPGEAIQAGLGLMPRSVR